MAEAPKVVLAPVTDLAITFLPNHPEGDKYARFGKIGNPAFLWLRRGEGDPIHEVKVCYGDAEPEEGYVKLPDDLNKNTPSGRPVYLCVRRGGEGSPIIDMKISLSSDLIVGPGFFKADGELNPDSGKDAVKEYLCFKTQASQAKLDAAEYRVGDDIDCLDTADKWCVARVMGARGEELLIHYKGWSEKWNEWIPKNSKRLAPFRTKTLGRETGWEGDKDAYNLTSKKDEFLHTVTRLDELSAKAEAADFAGFTREEQLHLNETNYRAVLNCLNAIVDDVEMLPVVQGFFHKNLSLATRLLSRESGIAQCWPELISKIFKSDAQSRFYTKYGVKGEEPNVAGKFAVRLNNTLVNPDDKTLVSAYLIQALNFFGEIGGFDVFRDRLTNPKWEEDSFFVTALIIKALYAARPHLVKEWFQEYIRSLNLAEVFTRRLHKIDDNELKTLSQENINETLRDLTSLLTHSGTPDVADTMGRVQLEVALRLLRSKVLAKKLNGCAELEAKLNIVRPALPTIPGAPPLADISVSKLDAAFYVKWISENKVVDLFLEPGQHEQIVKRSPTLLKFLSNQNALSVEHVETLWHAAEGKHEGLVRIVYDTIADLAQSLPDSQLDALFARLAAVPFEEYTDYVLNFVKNFTVSAVRATKDKTKWFGLDLFWQMIQDDVKVSEELSALAAKTLRELLELEVFEPQRPVYIDKCLKAVATHTSVVPALRLLQGILSLYPSSRDPRVARTTHTLEEVLTHLQGRSKIIDLVLLDMKHYNQAAAKHVEESKSEPDSNLVVGRFKHTTQLLTRLDVLHFIVGNFDSNLTTAAVDVLWEVFVTNAVTPDDKNLLLEWLAKASEAGRSHYAPFQADVMKYVFTTYFCDSAKLDFVNINKKGYDCFENYLVSLNVEQKTLSTPLRKFMAVTSFENLLGLDSLWEMAASVADPAVAALPKHFLGTLYIRLDFKYTPDEKKAIFKQFIDRCMTLLIDAGSALQAGKDADVSRRRANALLDVLEGFLSRCEAGETVEKPRFHKGEKIHANWKGGARIYGATVMAVNADGTYDVLYDDNDRDPNCPEANMRPLSGVVEEKRPLCESVHYPKLVLSNEKKYFDLLFELLEIGGELGPKVWKLLVRLPTNQDVERSIRTLSARHPDGKVDWSALLPGKAAIKLLYSLQIIDTFFAAPETDEAGRKALGEWAAAFVREGGLQHLAAVVAHVDEKAMVGELLTQKCLLLMLRLLCNFLSGTAADISGVVGSVDFGQLAGKLMHVIAAATHATIFDAAKPVAVPKAPPRRDEFYGPRQQHDTAMVPREGEPSAAAAAAAAAEKEKEVLPADDTLTSALRHAFDALVAALQHKPELLEAVYAFGGWREVVVRGVLQNASPNFRKAASSGLFQLCQKFNKVETRPPRAVFLPLVLSCLEVVETVDAAQTNFFFNLLVALLKGSSPVDGSYEPEKLAGELVDMLKRRPVVEKRFDDKDNVLCGIMQLTTVLLAKYPSLKEQLGHGLIDELARCLFEVPTASSRRARIVPPPKCKSAESRKLGFALLKELVKGSGANATKLQGLLVANHVVCRRGADDWFFEPHAGEEKSDTGYVGLKNLGCICYMNATLQQIFMIPQTRANLLAIDTSKEDAKESVTYQLQTLMAQLQESEKQYADPKGLCWAFKDFDGNPVNVSIQEDAGGFYTRLIDKVNESIKNTAHKDAFQSTLAGVYSHEFIGKTCPHYREREEEFYAVTLEVKNKKTMDESLRAFVEGEMLQGDNAYKCAVCNAKVDTLKRQCLKKLPPSIAFVMKRFELDYTTLQTTKVNDRLEFPQTLDLKPYCKENLPLPPYAFGGQDKPPEGKDGKPEGEVRELEEHPDEYYQYELKGIVVHTGTATAGHYYSFIKERVFNEETGEDEGKWFEFNDTIVRPFDPAEIPAECFGGKEEYGARLYQKSRNGYLLFYDRVRPKKPAASEAKAASAAEAKAEVAGSEAAEAPTPVSKLIEAIWEENQAYYRDRAVFDRAYFELVNEVCNLEAEAAAAEAGDAKAAPAPSSGPVEAKISDFGRLATLFVLNTLARARHKDGLSQWLSVLKRLYSSDVNAAAWLLEQFCTTRWNFEFLLCCSDFEGGTGPAVAQILTSCLALLSPLEHASFELPLPPKELKEGETAVPDTRGFVVRFIDHVVSLLRYAPERWKTFAPYFQVLEGFASLGVREARYLERMNLTARLVDLYLGDESPNPAVGDIPVDAKGRRRRMGDAYTAVDSAPLLSLLSVLIRSHLPESGDPKAPTLAAHPADLPPQPLSKVAQEMLGAKMFMPRLLLEATTRKRGRAIGDAVAHMVWEHEALSQALIGRIFAGFEQFGILEIRSYFRVIRALVGVKDSLQAKRVEWVLESLLNVMAEQSRYWKMTDFCLEHLIRLAKNSQPCYDWLAANGAKFEWAIRWLHTNERPPRGLDPNEQTVMYKPSRNRHESHWSMTPPTHTGLPPRQKAYVLSLIKEGSPIGDENASDSDIDLAEREFEVGQWVDALDTSNQWLCAQVVKVHGSKIWLKYDRWDERWNAWFDKGSPRVQALGFKTTSKQIKERGQPPGK